MARKLSYKKRLLDLGIVCTLVLFASGVIVLFHPGFLVATFLFFGIPAAFLLWRKPSNIKKAATSAFIFGVIWGFSFDYVAEFNNAWSWATNTSLVFSVHFFGVVSLDIMIWYFLWVFLVIAFYEYFVEHDFSRKLSKRALPIAITGAIVGVVIVTLSRFFPSLILIPYTYLWLGSLALLPYAYVVIRKPSIFTKSLSVVPFFFFLYLAFELAALYTGLWSFPGHYIGSVVFGVMSFPVEEFLFWIIASSAVAVAYHERAVDDEK
jgi:hypothetical protein